MSNDLVLRETGLRQNWAETSHLHIELYERPYASYVHVARLPTEDPAHWILFRRDPRDWTLPRGRPRGSRLRQVESLRDWILPAQRLPGRWSDGGRRCTVARWMRRRGAPTYAPTPDLTCTRAQSSRTLYLNLYLGAVTQWKYVHCG